MENKKNVTIGDIAREVGVSKNTISRYLNGKYEFMSKETKEKIEKVIEEKNYRPSNIARSLSTRKSKLFGVVVSDIENPFAASTIKGISEASIQNDYNFIIADAGNSIEKEKKVIDSFIEQRVDAILINPIYMEAPHILKASKVVPVVLLDRDIVDTNLDCVFSDNFGPVEGVIRHLIDNGYNNVHLFTEPLNKQTSRTERYNNFQDILKEKGYNDYKKRVHILHKENTDEIISALKDVRAFEGKAAVFITNGPTLIQVALVVKKLGLKVPEEIAICGYDDFGSISKIGWAQLAYREITTVAPNWYDLGKNAVAIAQRRIDNFKIEPIKVKIRVELMPRESTKKVD